MQDKPISLFVFKIHQLRPAYLKKSIYRLWDKPNQIKEVYYQNLYLCAYGIDSYENKSLLLRNTMHQIMKDYLVISDGTANVWFQRYNIEIYIPFTNAKSE